MLRAAAGKLKSAAIRGAMVKIKTIIWMIRGKGILGFLRFSIPYCANKLYLKKYLPPKCFIPPIALQIETSTVCNLRCKMCEYSYQKKNSRGRLMSLEEFKVILSKFPPTISLDMTGIGEPFLNPDFIKMVRFAKKRGSNVVFSTNGILMKENQMDDLINIGVDMISFSVDASTKETHERIRAGSSFEKLVQNISVLSEKIRSQKKGTRLQLSYTLSKDNIFEAVHFPKFAEKVGVDTIFYQDLLTFNRFSTENRVDTLFDKEFRRHLKEEILSEASRLGINAHPCESLTDVDGIRKKMCYRPWTTCFVDISGNLYPCCRLTQQNIDIIRFSFGNIHKQDLKDIWNNSEYRALRKGIAHPTHIPSLCRGCSSLRKNEVEKS